MASEPAPVRVSVWGELRGERKMPGVLRVLVGGQHAGTVDRTGDAWVVWPDGLRRSRPSSHPSADDAVRAVLRSSWARKLGARAASPVQWTDRARRLAGRKS